MSLNDAFEEYARKFNHTSFGQVKAAHHRQKNNLVAAGIIDGGHGNAELSELEELAILSMMRVLALERKAGFGQRQRERVGRRRFVRRHLGDTCIAAHARSRQSTVPQAVVEGVVRQRSCRSEESSHTYHNLCHASWPSYLSVGPKVEAPTSNSGERHTGYEKTGKKRNGKTWRHAERARMAGVSVKSY
jgi:hypothetical protein